MSPVEDLVRRTLAEVADALPVGDPPPVTSDVAALAPARRPRRARLAVLAAAAAAVLVGVGVWAVQSTSDEGSVGVTSPGPPEARYLPDGVSRAGTTVWAAGAGDLEASLATGPGPDDALVALSASDLGRLDHAALAVAAHVGAPAPVDRGEDAVTYGLGPAGRFRVYVARAGAEVDTGALAAAASADVPADADIDGAGAGVRAPWSTRAVDLTWLPGVGRGVGTGYAAADGPRSAPVLTVLALAADLPGDDVARAFLDGAMPVTVGDDAGWAVSYEGGATVLLQVAPGVVGVVGSPGLPLAELFRVADGVRWPAGAAEPPGEACGAPPGTAVRASGLVGLSGTADRPYEAAAWPGRGVPRSRVTCAEVTVGGDRFELRLVGSGGGSGAPVAVAPVAATGEEVTLLAVHDEGTIFTGPGVSTQPVEVDAPHGSGLTFVGVLREGGAASAPVTVHVAGGEALLTLHVGFPPDGSAGDGGN